MKKSLLHYAILALFGLLTASCSKDDDEPIQDAAPQPSEESVDFYVLNEGGWGSNNASLDYFDRGTSTYYSNVFSTINPDVTLGLGDTGNDLEVYKDKLYAVMNGSGMVEIMDKSNARHLGAISISGCRNIAFHGDYAYVSSYAPVDGNAAEGSVWKINVSTLQVEGKCPVGRQPEALVAHNGKLYVCNSGGYMTPAYERHISVIDLSSFTEVEKIDIAENINRIVCDENGTLYIGSAGNYSSISPALYIYDTKQKELTGTLSVAPSQLWLSGEKLYILGTNYITYTQTLACYDTRTKTLNTNPFSESVTGKLTAPYSIAVHPSTKEILITDAKDYTSLGMIYCISPDGTSILWENSAGICPGHIAFK